MSTAAAEPALLFSWRPPRTHKRTIVLFICASALFHAIGFYLFQIVYPTTVVLLPPPARVSLITADTDEGLNMLRWIEAEDPALASAPQRPPETRRRTPPKTAHIPSYLTYRPVLKHAPPVRAELATPELDPPGPVPSPPIAPANSLGRVPSRLTFSEELAAAGPPSVPAIDFNLSSSEAPEAIRFRVGLGPDGVIRYVFALNSSGDPALDEQARHYLNLVRFAPKGDGSAPEQTTWGVAVMHWGNDLKRVSPVSPAPAPP